MADLDALSAGEYSRSRSSLVNTNESQPIHPVRRGEILNYSLIV